MKTNQQFWQAFWISKFGCFNLHKLVCFRGDFGDKQKSGYMFKNTSLKTNMSPEKGPFQKEISFFNHQFSGDFQGVYTTWCSRKRFLNVWGILKKKNGHESWSL